MWYYIDIGIDSLLYIFPLYYPYWGFHHKSLYKKGWYFMWKIFPGLFSRIEVKQRSTKSCSILRAGGALMNSYIPFEGITDIKRMFFHMQICCGEDVVIVPYNKKFYNYLRHHKYQKYVKSH